MRLHSRGEDKWCRERERITLKDLMAQIVDIVPPASRPWGERQRGWLPPAVPIRLLLAERRGWDLVASRDISVTKGRGVLVATLRVQSASLVLGRGPFWPRGRLVDVSAALRRPHRCVDECSRDQR